MISNLNIQLTTNCRYSPFLGLFACRVTPYEVKYSREMFSHHSSLCGYVINSVCSMVGC